MPIIQDLSSSNLLVLMCLGLLLLAVLAAMSRRTLAGYAYSRKPLLSAWERKAATVLSSQLRPGLHLCPQVRLADMLLVKAKDRKTYWSGLNRVTSKSIDFVVVDLASGGALLAIELDDKTHQRDDRKRRDAFVNDALRQAGIPLVRFVPRQTLDIRQHL